MIKFKLICKNCENQFDSWFSNSKDYEKLVRLKHLVCINCNSFKVEKTLMSPSVLKGETNKDYHHNYQKFTKVKKEIQNYQKFVKKNFEFVGDDFTYEARSLYYGSKKIKSKGIYGNATHEEIKELKEEGIEMELAPWVHEKDN